MEVYVISKIKYSTKDKKIRIEYSQGENEYTMSSVNPPKPELLLALWNMAEDVNEICDLNIPEESVLNFIQVTGITLSDSENGTGVTITALKTLKKYSAPLVINTPHLFDDSPNPESKLPDSTYRKIVNLAIEANKYLNGQYGDGYQLDLFMDEKEKKQIEKEIEKEKAFL